MQKSKFRKVVELIINIFVNIFFVLAIILLIFGAYNNIKYQQNPEDNFIAGYKIGIVSTGSMEPTMMTNSIILIEKTDYKNVKKDDIIMYKVNEMLISHRVIDVTEEGIFTKGDNNNTADAYILKPENIKGKIIHIFNGSSMVINYIINASKSPKLILKFLVLPVFMLICLIIPICIIKNLIFPKRKQQNKYKNIKLLNRGGLQNENK